MASLEASPQMQSEGNPERLAMLSLGIVAVHFSHLHPPGCRYPLSCYCQSVLGYQGLSFGYQRVIFMDKCLRHLMAKYIDKIVTFSNHKTIFGRPTISIANGIDFNAVPLKTNLHPKDDKLHLVAVATIHPWHGFDRAIRGIATYAPTRPNVVLHIVGEGVPAIMDRYHQLVTENHLEESVIFHGPLF